jgi:hypothetical protein
MQNAKMLPWRASSITDSPEKPHNDAAAFDIDNIAPSRKAHNNNAAAQV